MAGRLHLYRFAPDAWSGGLEAWCREAGARWLILENTGQRRWLRRRMEGIAVPEGLEIFDAQGLREKAAALAGLAPSPGPEHGAALGALLVRAAGRKHEGFPRDPRLVLEAADRIAGETEAQAQILAGLPSRLARELAEALRRAAVTPGAFDARLAGALPALAARVCWLGWDASRWGDGTLVEAVTGRAGGVDFFVPSPRLPADGVQREWIETLERKFELTRAMCGESGFESGNEALVSRLEGSETGGAVSAAPEMLPGRAWHDQVGLVCQAVEDWSRQAGEEGNGEPIGIVAPEHSPTAAAVAAALAARGLAVERPGRGRELPPALLVAEQAARYHLGGHDLEDLTELAALLFTHFQERWGALHPEKVRQALERAFRGRQSRNARVLLLGARGSAAQEALAHLVDVLGRWDEEASWADWCARWEAMAGSLHLPAGALPRPPAGLFPRRERLPGRLFMEWVTDEMRAQRQDRPVAGEGAAVVVTTAAGAAHQTWGRLVFLDSNDHVWPAAFADNPFLAPGPSGKIPGRLAARDLWALDQARFLDLVEHCAGGIAFAGVQLAPTESGAAEPNEWVLRTLLAAGAVPADGWRARPGPEEPARRLPEAKRFAAIHASRRDPLMPSDQYAFNLGGSKIESPAWSPTRLDEALTCPATFALAELFGAKAPEEFVRHEAQAVGSLMHDWITRLFQGGPALTRLEPTEQADPAARLPREVAATRRALEEAFAAAGLRLPLWWESCLQKAAWATRRCARELAPLIGAQYCAMEQKWAATVRTEAGPLRLAGRVDVLLSDRPELAGARVNVLDFKTGRSGGATLATLDRGEGHQFAAYYLMARDAGAASAAIGVIRPAEALRTVFGDGDEEALRARFARLAELQRSLRFERRGPLAAEFGRCETLPMATAPIDPKVLEHKAGLVLLAS